MAIINSENIHTTVWVALKRLDLNGWSVFSYSLFELHLVKQQSSWGCHGNVNKFAVESLLSAFLQASLFLQ